MSLNVENLAKQGKITAESVLGGVTEDDNDNVSTAAGSEISEGFALFASSGRACSKWQGSPAARIATPFSIESLESILVQRTEVLALTS